MKAFRDIRLIPLALVGIASLGLLKIAGLMMDGGYIFANQPQLQSRSWAQETLNFPSSRRLDPADITGSVASKPKEEPKPVVKAPEAMPVPSENILLPEQSRPVTASERAVLERLQSRRQELEARARELDIRESLLKAAEQRIEARVEDLKVVESRIGAATEQKGQADVARFKTIVTMYEGMKPKDAAKIFDRLDMAILLDVATQIAPRKMSDILGLMQPEAAERLTVEMARRLGGDRTASAQDLPKIEGRPLVQPRN